MRRATAIHRAEREALRAVQTASPTNTTRNGMTSTSNSPSETMIPTTPTTTTSSPIATPSRVSDDAVTTSGSPRSTSMSPPARSGPLPAAPLVDSSVMTHLHLPDNPDGSVRVRCTIRAPTFPT